MNLSIFEEIIMKSINADNDISFIIEYKEEYILNQYLNAKSKDKEKQEKKSLIIF